jgi:hypothetical protein
MVVVMDALKMRKKKRGVWVGLGWVVAAWVDNTRTSTNA